MPKQQPGDSRPATGLRRWLGKNPERTLLRLAAAFGGLWLAAAALALIWPKPDQIAIGSPSAEDPSTLAPLPSKPVTVLVIGVDADQLSDMNNKAAPLGPANADSLMLVQIAVNKPVEVLQLPTELGINLPGSNRIEPLAASYRQGGVALTSDVINEIVELPEGAPQRYLVISRKGLRTLVDGIGQLEVTLGQPYASQDKTQGYAINLQAGRQSFNGVQAEQLARYRSNPKDDQNRRKRQQLLVLAIAEQLRQPNTVSTLAIVLNELSDEIQTDLSRNEILSLVAATLTSPSMPVISQLSLASRAGDQPLRQLNQEESLPSWPESH